MKCGSSVIKSRRGNSIIKYLMVNDVGMEVEVLNLGAILKKVIVPDKDGNFENVVLEWPRKPSTQEKFI